ncbi:hypothetical protein EDC04DRAFT_2937544, partial [Pisolithus marmoratus]
MLSKLFTYSQPTTIGSVLIQNPPNMVLPMDDLDTLYNDLKLLQQKSMEWAKRVGEDLKTLDKSMCHMKEKVRGKAKAVEKANWECCCM